MRRRVLAIVNPISGYSTTKPRLMEIRRLISTTGAEFTVQHTEAPGHACEFAAWAAHRYDALLVVGGDGTVAEVINGLDGRPLPFAILRTGTENLLAREFGMPTEPADVADTLLEGKPFHVDMGIVNDRRFLAVTGVGFDAEVVLRLSQHRTGHISHATYLLPLWQTFLEHRFPFLRVEADGELVFEDRGLAFVGVIGRYSLGLRILANARIDDGLLDLCVMPCTTRRHLISLALDVVARRHTSRPDVIYRQVVSVRITSSEEGVPVEIDGDCGACLPIDCRIVPRAAVLLTPTTRSNRT